MPLNHNTIRVGDPSPSLKRHLPDSQHRSRGTVKRRSSRACCSCRARKVRCDITVHGHPCTNCGLDNVDCVLVASKRGPKPRSKPPHPLMQLQSHAELSHENHQHFREEDGVPHCQEEEEEEEEEEENNEEPSAAPMTPESSSRDHGAATVSEEPATASSPPRAPDGKIYEVAVGLTFDHDDDANDNDDGEDDDDGKAHDDRNPSVGGGDGVGQNTPYLQSTAYGHTGSSLGSASSAAAVDSGLYLLNSTLPPFIRPLPKTVAQDDLEFLDRKGAFIMPEAEIRDEILRSYVSTVHPFMPILDIRTFLTSVRNNDTCGRISLLLFQAVMFAGLSALDQQLIERMGFQNAKHARQVFFARARFLHDLDVEPDDNSMLQALLLMSLWYGGRQEQRHTWYYTGLALSLAQSMGLHREPEYSHPERSLRRRLWWSLYIRDRLIALGTRRPMRIRDDDHDVSMLSRLDFDCEPRGECLDPFFTSGRAMEDTGQQTYLSLMCIELAKLCICIGRVLTSQYTTLGRRLLWTKGLMVVPKHDLEQPTDTLEIEQHDREIADWYQGLHPDVAKVARRQATEWSSSSQAEWHWTVVDMLRLTLIGLLHRPRGFRPFPTDATINTPITDLIKESRTKLKSAARELTGMAHRMLNYDQIRYLPTSGVPMLLSASLTHMLDLEGQDADVRDASLYRFDQTVRALKQLREIYASADSAINYLGMVIQKTGLSSRVSQLAAIAPEFRCTTPRRRRNSTAVTTANRRRDSRALTATGLMLPRLNGQSRHDEDEDAAVRASPQTGALIPTIDTGGAQEAILGPNQDGQVYPNFVPAETFDRQEFGLVAMSATESFGTLSLPARDTSDVEMQVEGGGGTLDQQSILTQDTLFGPLRSLDYDIDPKLFNAQFGFYDNNLFWMGSGGDNR